MSSCLGLYIENNIIKYAKVSKDHDNLKIDAFGIKFYEKLGDAIDQVVEETYSQKTPISVNMSEEMYNYFNMYALLTKSDLQKAIRTEFEAYCADKGYNPNVFETRYAVADNQLDRDKLRIIHIADNKIELNKRIQQISDYHLGNVSPIGMSIPNLAQIEKDENCIIVNIEDHTELTTIINGKIYNVEKLDEGSQEILDKINLRENSYSKAYEICKNTTIYTSEGRELQSEEEGYLADIMPTLYNIVGQVKKAINSTTEKIEKVYITGTASLVNNIDLYFQEYLTNAKCEILKPEFIQITPEINIKDYIEVNSAIAVALMGLGEGIQEMNFKTSTTAEKIKAFFTLDINSKNDKPKDKKLASGLFTNDLKEPLDQTEKTLLNIMAAIIILFVVYSGFSMLLKNQFNKKSAEADSSISNTKQQISLIDNDDNSVKQIKNDYTTKISNLDALNKRIEEKNKVKGSIPTLLNQLMNVIPNDVQIKSIQNTNTSHVEITVESPKYEQIAFLIGSIKTEVILTNVISTSGQKNNDVITVKIEGDLP